VFDNLGVSVWMCVYVFERREERGRCLTTLVGCVCVSVCEKRGKRREKREKRKRREKREERKREKRREERRERE